jgi:hypothetical protein
MTEPVEGAKDAALWQRWRQHAHPATGRDAADWLALAAYAEGRLDETQAEPVEDWLAEHPEALADLTAARAAAASPLPAASEAVIARAAALVEPMAGAQIIPFRTAAGPHRPAWRMAMAWSGIAASLLVTSLAGFALGNDAYLNLVGRPAAESTIHELLDPPSVMFADDEEPAT